MKKITLALFGVVLSSVGFSQATYNLVAPADDNGVSSFRAPNGTAGHAYQRSIMFIHEWELLPMNLSTINTISFQYDAGTGSIPVIGNFTLYLENTTDTDLLKPNSFSAVTATMNTAYVGTYTVPGGTAAATITLPLSTPFNYTGGGLYAAWSFTSAGPFATAAAVLNSNQAETGWLIYNASGTAPVNTFTAGSFFRPSLIFNAANTATNEIEVVKVETPGKVSKLESTTQDVVVTLVNSSIGAQSNVTVGITAIGANATTASSVIASMPAGSTSTVSFPYTTLNLGLSTITGAVLFNDQNTTNNTKATTQSVTCNVVALAQPTTPVNDYTSYTVGNGVLTAFKHTTGTQASSLTSVSVVIPSFANAGNSGKQVYAVVTDMAGAIIAKGNTLTIGGANMGVSQPLTFTPPVPLNPNTPYLFGVGTTSTGYFPVGTIGAYQIPGYYQMPIAGFVAPTPVFYGHMSLEANLMVGSQNISVSATKTLVCRTSPQTVTLTATGADTYTWSAGLGQGSSVTVTPSNPNANQTQTIITVAGSYTTAAAAGCKSANATITLSLSACTGLMDEANAEAIRLFPNPAVNGKTNISGLSGVNTITVFNTIGQAVITQTTSDENAIIDMSNLAPGNYILKVTNSENLSRTYKLVNQN